MTVNVEVNSLVVAARLISSSFVLVRVSGYYLEAANEKKSDGGIVPVTVWTTGVPPGIKSKLSSPSSEDVDSDKN